MYYLSVTQESMSTFKENFSSGSKILKSFQSSLHKIDNIGVQWLGQSFGSDLQNSHLHPSLIQEVQDLSLEIQAIAARWAPILGQQDYELQMLQQQVNTAIKAVNRVAAGGTKLYHSLG